MSRFPLAGYALAFLGAFATTAMALPFWRRWCRRLGWVDDPGGRKDHAQPIALAGGLGIFTGLLFVTVGGMVAIRLPLLNETARQALEYGFGRRAIPLAAIFAGAVGMLLLGWWDDRRELRAGPKFVGQFLIAALVAGAGVRLTLFVPSVVFSYLVTILWILTITNAMNFLDNMNGLASGVGAIAAGWFAIAAIRQGQYLVALLALAVCGALAGFLPFNFPTATTFLGDSGSHLTGFLLSIVAILPHFYSTRHPDPWLVLSPLAILAVPLGDLISVVILRTRRGLPFWIGDQNHWSHRLVRAGMSRSQAVVALWVLSAICGSMALL